MKGIVHIYHVLRGPQLDDEFVCKSYEEYLEYFKDLRKMGRGTRYLYTQTFFCGGHCNYHYYLREVDENGKQAVS